MKNSFITLSFFFGGICFGVSDIVPEILLLPSLPTIVLSLLMVQVGIGLGARRDLSTLLHSLHWSMLLLPFFTIVGTLAFSALASLIFKEEKLADILAVGSGFGYYSLSSVLILDMKSATVGIGQATQIATIALLANVMREVFALLFCPTITRKGNGNAAISIAGISSMDVCLPLILSSKADSQSLLPAAIFHGFILEISVPLLISLFCQ